MVLRTIALPLNEILATPAPSTGIQDLLNEVNGMSVNIQGRRRGYGRRAKSAGQRVLTRKREKQDASSNYQVGWDAEVGPMR